MTTTATKAEPTTSTIVINTTIVDGKAKRQLTARIEDQLTEAANLLLILSGALPEADAKRCETAYAEITSLLGGFHPAKRKAAK